MVSVKMDDTALVAKAEGGENRRIVFYSFLDCFPLLRRFLLGV